MSDTVRHWTIHGARGSYPVSGERFRRYGGSTSCFSVETKTGLIIVDAGTGIAALGDELFQRPSLPPITILFTHFHLDHVIGLPAFKPFLREDAKVTLLADAESAGDWPQALKTSVGKPFWPFGLAESNATVRFEDLPRRKPSAQMMGPITLYGMEVSWCAVWHPQGCVNYRFALPEQTLVLATDREHGNPRLDAIFQEFCHGVDVLIHDAQYTPEEYPNRSGWGHSTWEQGATLAEQLGAKQLVLTSHDPSRSDEEIDRLVECAQRIFPNTVAAAEEMTLGETPTEQRPVAPPVPRPRRVSVHPRPQQDEGEHPLTFRYTFTFDDGNVSRFTLQLDPKTLQLIQPVQASYPEWTALSYYKCTNCPLSEAQHPQCPAATGLMDVVEEFRRSISLETVDVTLETDARTYVKRAKLPEAVSSLMGILMVTSGCPVMGKLRPMVRHHLPFATLEETKYRVFSMYLLGQFFAEKHGHGADWDLKELPKLYDEIRRVNREFFRRLSNMEIEDASLNAIVRLDAFADSISFSVDQQTLEDLEELFQAYLGQS